MSAYFHKHSQYLCSPLFSSPSSGFNSTANLSPPPQYPPISNSSPSNSESILPDMPASNLLAQPPYGPISLTKPIPPPASLPRKPDPSAMKQRVVYPPKESCFKYGPLFPARPYLLLIPRQPAYHVSQYPREWYQVSRGDTGQGHDRFG